MPEYTSYMIQNHLTFPQDVADYYNHLAFLPSTADLESDIIRYFPFTPFQTFVTAFPWYTSILSKAGKPRMYLPEDFITQAEAEQTTSISTVSNNNTAKPSNTGSTNKASKLIIPLGSVCFLVNIVLL
ncbi:hypothetical protein RNJ44_04562 [Nakaseomyces bracarensis]|uniref:Uncharacterized protein n=1 Tax=Nakaseomyces bracarensis TaxID=273131 RepID=A0ABR4NV88_9SACH